MKTEITKVLPNFVIEKIMIINIGLNIVVNLALRLWHKLKFKQRKFLNERKNESEKYTNKE
jgi:hypothetical protein